MKLLQKMKSGGNKIFTFPSSFRLLVQQHDAHRALTGTIDDLKKQRNIVQKEVATKKKANQPCDDLVAKIKSIGDEVIAAELEQKNVRQFIRTTCFEQLDLRILILKVKIEVDAMVNKIGNLVDPSVPVSQDEDKDNLVVRTWGTPRDPAGHI